MTDSPRKIQAKLKASKTSISKIFKNVGTTEFNEETSFEKIQSQFDRLTTVFEEFERLIFESVSDEMDENEEEMKLKSYSEYEDKFISARSELKRKLAELSNETFNSAEHLEKSSVKSERSTNGKSPIGGKNLGVKIPKIEINKFDGKEDEFLKFYETFKAIINDNEDLSDFQKFHYLLSTLGGRALNLIDGIQISEENYKFAWETLVNHYKNNKLLSEIHIGNIFEAKKIEIQSATNLKELHNTFLSNLNALKKLGIGIEGGDIFLVYLMSSKLDNITLRSWEQECAGEREIATYDRLEKFVVEQYKFLESFEKKKTPGKTQKNNTEPKKGSSFFAPAIKLGNCPVCGQTGWHPLYKCPEFLKVNLVGRREIVKKHNCCYTCLSYNHKASQCKGRLCTKCGNKHNYLVCNKNESGNAKGNNNPNQKEIETVGSTNNMKNKGTNSSAESSQSQRVVALCAVPKQSRAILPTVLAIVKGSGKNVIGRFVLDSGSELNFISSEFAKKLNLCGHSDNLTIRGVGKTSTYSKSFIQTQISSRDLQFTEEIKFYTLPEFTYSTRTYSFSAQIPKDILKNLADQECYHCDNMLKVDGLLGVDIFFRTIGSERLVFGHDNDSKSISFIKTKFGWIYGGVGHELNTSQSGCFLSLGSNDKVKNSTKNGDDEVEHYFKNTTTIHGDGKYTVSLPFKESPEKLGDSFEGALSRFKNLERKLDGNLSMKTQYIAFMQEYLDMKHMEIISQSDLDTKPRYYIPHHAIFKESSTSSLRVVFDASFKTTNGLSLNQILCIGPALHNDIFKILLSFRFPLYALSGDVAKMYRQIWIEPRQRDLQRILWRENSEQPIGHYRLKTITYGTSPAPYLAIRCLHEIANEIKDSEPEIARIIRQDFFMDDVLTGADSFEDLIQIQRRLETILNKRGLPLRKWCSNSKLLMQSLTQIKENHYTVELGKDDAVKTLGIKWNPDTDNLVLIVNDWKNKNISKRQILADINSVWDPLGFLAPILIKGKIFLQEMWREKFTWDETLPHNLAQKWLDYRQKLLNIQGLEIPRHIGCGTKLIQFEIHGFCDAGAKAYAACIYIKTSTTVKLLCSKTRVAPLNIVSIPRLELLGAVLLAETMNSVVVALNLQESQKAYYWSDSRVVLSWLNGFPSQWQTYVGNRVARIQELTDIVQWRYVASKENPADIPTRGISPGELKENSLWWEGPQWLTQDLPYTDFIPCEDVPEVKTIKFSLLTSTNQSQFWSSYCNRFSTWKKLTRVTAYMIRFYKNLKGSIPERKSNELSVDEIQRAIDLIIKIEQNDKFATDIEKLKRKGKVSTKSSLAPLSPYLDHQNNLRVGGRLRHSQLSVNQQHPLLIPYKSRVTELVLRDLHETKLHCGPQTLLVIAREKYWPIKGKSAVKAITHSCVTCRKSMPYPLMQQMADLPKDRVTPARPFEVTGIDFCGPVNIKIGLRKGTTMKAYIAIFICFTTKAVHLELVTSLSAEAFISTFKRFVARRGLCRQVYSDNGTNFVGAAAELQKLFEDKKIIKHANYHGINWTFNPPRAPHFGGLWESNIRIIKLHLNKILRETVLNFEDFYTTLTQIESVINSRPLYPMSDDPNDLNPLTPNHFLLSDSSVSLPEPNFTDKKLLKRYEKLQGLYQEFWKRWSAEYLNSLQSRHKWRFLKNNVKLGTLVVLKEDHQPPHSWKMARIISLHPGQDGAVRVVTVKTANGTLRRPITKICPILDEENEI